MANPDRRTTIHGDQIEDGTVDYNDLDTVQFASDVTPEDGAFLTYNLVEDKMDFKMVNFGRFNTQISSEAETQVSSLVTIDKINTTTQSLPVGLYRFSFSFEAETASATHGFISTFIIDGTEYAYNSLNHNKYITYSGFIYLSFATATTHNLRLTIASNKANKVVSIRRARIEMWRF